MEFDPDKALAYARALARPRLVGSGEDERVAQELTAQLESFGYLVEREPFQYTRAFDIALSLEICLVLALIVAAICLPAYKALSGVSLLILILGAPGANRVIQQLALAPDPDPGRAAGRAAPPRLKLGRLYRAANIIARPRPVTSDPRGDSTLYLMAHLDSKSQRMPIVFRVGLVLAFMASLLLFNITILMPGDVSPQAWSIIFGGLALVFGSPLLLLDVGNASPGAIDNAAGAGLVLHLAEVLQTRRDLLDPIRLTVLITSAEEMGTMGALYHVRRNLAELRREARKFSVHILNFDGPGIDGGLFVSARGRRPGALARMIAAAGQELNIPLGHFWLPGVLFDHVPFQEHGFDAASLMTIGKATWAVHTARDTPDKLHPHGFEIAGRVALRVIEMEVEAHRRG